MRSGEWGGDGGRSDRVAPSPPPAPSAATSTGDGGSGASRLGPWRFGPGYSPWKDPTVLLLVAISLIAAVLFVGGATFGPALSDDGGGDGVFPVFDLLSSDDGDDVALSLAANRTELTAGERVAFAVTDGNGTPVRDASVAVDGDRYDVDGSGSAVVRIDRSGTISATARAPGANDTTVESDVVELSVGPRTVGLAVRANRSTATAGEPIELTLVRTDTGERVPGSIAALGLPAEGATSEATDGRPGPTLDGRAGATGWLGGALTDDGHLVVVPDRAGQIRVHGTHADGGEKVFEPTTESVSIERRQVPLELTVDSSEVVTGESVSATVRRGDTGEPVAATLTVGDRTVETGPDGTASVTFETAGTRTVEATAARTPAVRFLSADAAVEVDRRQVALALDLDRTAITDGGSVRATVTRVDTGEPVEATVTVAGRSYATGGEGTVEMAVTIGSAGDGDPEHGNGGEDSGHGDRAVVATAPNTSAVTFAAAERTLTVSNATIELADLAVPDRAVSGQTVTVSATARSLGPADGTDTFQLVIDGEVVASEVVTLADGEESTVELSGTVPAEAGTYDVAIRGSDGTATGEIDVGS